MEQINNNEKRKLYSLFHNFKSQAVTTELRKTQDSDVLIVDGMNTFCRAFAANPQLNSDGMHIGGITGFLKSIGYAIKLLNPTKCIIIFDGPGGSVRRKKIFPEYKQHRSNKVRLNRIYEQSSTSESENQAISRQLIHISHYIDCLPVNISQIDFVEADDIIAYLSLNSFKNYNITIMSSDKDFYQLIDNRIKVYSPTKKRIYGQSEILTEYGINAKNFILFRVLDGDISDGISGITGVGLKTVIKLFPFLSDDKSYCIDDLFNYSEIHKNKFKPYETILNTKNIIIRNYDLMQLKNTILSTHVQLNIEDLIKKKNKLNRFEFIKITREDKIGDVISLLWLNEVFTNLDGFVTCQKN